MFTVVISEKGGEQKRMSFDKNEVTIGRVQGNDIILPKGNVSKRHSRIVLKDGKFIIVDIKSTNGTYVNGRKITSPLVIKPTDKIYIGDFILTVDDSAGAGESATSADGPEGIAVSGPAPVVRKPAAAPPARRDDGMTETDMPEQRPPSLGTAARPAAAPVAAPRPAPAPAPAPAAPPRSALAAFAPSAPGAPREAPPVMAPGPAPVAAPPRVAVKPAAAPVAPPAISRPSQPAAPPAAAPASPAVSAIRRPVSGGPVGVARPSAAGTGARPAAGSRARDLLREVGQRWAERGSGDPEQGIQEIVAAMQSAGMLGGIDADALTREALSETVGLGALDELLADDAVRAVHVSRPDRILVVKNGRAAPAERTFSSAAAATRIAERLLLRAGRRPGDAAVHECVLDDGTRATVVLPPLATAGASILLRRPDAERLDLEQLTRRGMLSPAQAEGLASVVAARRNILVCGHPGAGRTTMAGALVLAVSPDERVVVVDVAGRFEAPGDNVTHLGMGVGARARESVHAALHLGADRLIVDELMGAEALDVVSALACGPQGAIVVSGGASPSDALLRVEALARIGGGDPVASRELVARAFQLIVQVAQNENGQRAIAGVYEISGIGAEGIELSATELG